VHDLKLSTRCVVQVFALLLGLGAGSTPASAQLFGVSEEQEIELGREAAKKVESDSPILRNDEITSYVNRVARH
jgi:hypothetical protein